MGCGGCGAMGIREDIIRLIREEKQIYGENLYRDCGFDSISFIGLLMKIEDMLSVTFEIDEMEECTDIPSLIALAEKKAEMLTMNEQN